MEVLSVSLEETVAMNAWLFSFIVKSVLHT